MLDMKWVRENRPALEKMLADRRSKLEIAPLYDMDAERRKILTDLERLQAEHNVKSKAIGNQRSGEDPGKRLKGAAVDTVADEKGKIKALEAKLGDIEPKLNDLLLRLNNIPDPSVPVGASAEENKVIREVGKI